MSEWKESPCKENNPEKNSSPKKDSRPEKKRGSEEMKIPKKGCTQHHWERIDWKESRVPEEAILAFLDKLETQNCLLHGFAMLDGGKMLAEGYWAPYTAESLHRMYSVGKSFVSLAVGLLEEEGKLTLDDRICSYFPEKCPEEGPHPWLAEMTVRQMLTMTTCHSKTTYKQYGGDWVESFFRVEPSNLPGAVFSYDTSSTHVLSALVEKLSGRKLMAYLREKCFDRIGVSKEAYFIPDPGGVSQGGSGLNCTLRDMLAAAELVMNEGVYEGERLLPADYIREAVSFQVSTRHQTAYDEQFGYGYQIWRGRHDSFYFYGIGGQLAVCLPKERFILAVMGNTLENKNGIKDIFDAFYDIVYPWLEDSRQADKKAVEMQAIENESIQFADHRRNHGRKRGCLADKLAELSLAQTLDASGLAYADAFLRGDFPWLGRYYSFEDNRLEISGLRVTCDKQRRIGSLFLEKRGRKPEISAQAPSDAAEHDSELFFGLDAYVLQSFPWMEEWGQREREYCKDVECLCQGFPGPEDTLFLRCHILEPEPANLVIVLKFGKGGVTIRMQKGIDNGLKHFEGTASGRMME